MPKRRKVDVSGADVDLTSMIDVCFLLIAFFIMVTEVTKSEIVEIFLPQASNASPDEDPPENRLIINIDREGKIYMRSRKFGKPNQKDNEREIRNALEGYAKNAGFEGPKKTDQSNLTVMVRADAHAEFRFVQCLMMMLTDPSVRVGKVHYSAKNPIKS